ncbi:prostaglandin E synthase 2-like [Babylonia areolata]|uniref:prostaglandin E synthase 2-like n=1 Tax=Babylonia areolata TaxID=304850 RepID=UPI003FCFB184
MRIVAAARTLESFVLNQQARSLRGSLSVKTVRSFSNAKGFWSRKRLAVAGSVAVAGVTLTSLVQRWLPHWQSVQAVSSVRPEIEPSRRVNIETDNSGLKLTLFQFQTCPFCCKVRAVLDYYGFSYDVVEVNSVTKKQIKWSNYKKVPIILVDGAGEEGFLQLNDSSVIVSVLESWRQDPQQSLEKLQECYVCIESEERGKKVYEFPNKYFIMFMDKTNLPSTPEQRQEERKWRKWADDHLVHMLSPNVYRTPSEALQAFHYFSEVGQWDQNFSTPERLMVIYTGAAVMYILGKILRKKYNLKEDVRESLYDACKEWTKVVGRKRKFLGGDQPNLADLAVYGVLNSIEGCQAFQEAQANTNIGSWYKNMQRAVLAHEGAHPLNKVTAAAKN